MYTVKEADVVIVGGGAAGAMAAIYARRTDTKLRVVVLDKSKLETSGAAGRGMDALNTIALPPYSEPEDIVEMLTKVTEGILDQEVAYAYGLLGPRVVAGLEKIMNRAKGDLFPVDEKGNYLLRYLHPTNKPMLLPMHGEEMKRALGKAVRESGAEVYDRTPALRIVTENGKVAGVFAFNIRTGEYFYFKTRAVCLTAG
ncbi:MAG TPA: FAD-dependent oxidoreductase, partial [Thermodesulfobacteriota bacterium]|nr:FAD-dependent oxidoreductase [Thermodesulfobacteriota bacterium]